MPGHSSGTGHSNPQSNRHPKGSSRPLDRHSQPHHHHHHHHHHSNHSRHYDPKYARNNSGPPQNGTARSSETIGFIPGSADNASTSRRNCGSCASVGWSSCKALICCVLTCGFYGSKEPCLPINESSTDQTKPSNESSHSNGTAISNPTCGVPMEKPKASKLPTFDSFRYPDVRIAGQKVRYPPVTASKRTRVPGKGETQRPVSNTSLFDEYDLDNPSDTGTDIDSLITKKLLELYALHQIDQLAKCTSDSSFSRKTNEISELIYSIAQDYNLEEQEAECKLVHGVIRISTRKGKRNKSQGLPSGSRANGRTATDGLIPDSGNETMTNTFSSDFPEVKVSEETPSDELARKMRLCSGKAYSSYTGYSPYNQHNTDSSGAPLLLI